MCSSPVATLEATAEGVRRVRTTDGRSVRATRAVVAGGHLQQLAGMLEGVEPPTDLVEARDTWRPGLSVFAVHAALLSLPATKRICPLSIRCTWNKGTLEAALRDPPPLASGAGRKPVAVNAPAAL